MTAALFHRLLLALPGAEERLIAQAKQACEKQDAAVLRRCLERGLHPNVVLSIGPNLTRRATLLGYAARNRFPEGIAVLLEHGALVDGTIPDHNAGQQAWADGKSPLALLTYFRQSDSQWEEREDWEPVEECARLLLRAGADIGAGSWSVTWRGDARERGPGEWSTVTQKIERLPPSERKAWQGWVRQELAFLNAKARSDALEAALPPAEPVVAERPRVRF